MAESKSRDDNRPIGPTIVFWLAVLIQFCDVLFGRLNTAPTWPNTIFLVLYLGLGMYAFFAFKKVNQDTKTPWYTQLSLFLGIGLLAYFVPLLGNYLGAHWPTFLGGITVALILIIAPTWIVFFIFFAEDALQSITRKFSFLILFCWIGLLIWSTLPVLTQVSNPLLDNEGGSAAIHPGDALKSIWTSVKATYNKLFTGTQKAIDQRLAYATGDAYTAKVDSNAQLKLGLTIDPLKTTQASFATTDKVGVFTTLKAQTIDKPLAVSVACSAKNGNTPVAVTDPPNIKVTPDTSTKPLDMSADESQDIDCQIEPNTFTVGRDTVTIEAKFDMTTLSYLKTYFMDKKRLRELRDAKIDPYTQYGITDRNPVSIYTSGPVSVAMGFSTPPIGIDQTAEEFVGTLGISLKNEWPGVLKDVKQVVLIVPKGITITSLTGTGTIVASSCDKMGATDWCDDVSSNVYEITQLSLPLGQIATGDAITLRAQVRIASSDYEGLLGATPISTKYFKAAVDYTYSLPKETTLLIRDASTETTSTECKDVMLATAVAIVPESSTATVTFTTNEKVSSELKYCIGPSIANKDCSPIILTSPTSNTTHEFKLTELNPDTLYSLEANVFCGDRIKLDEKTFQTTS